MDAFQMNMAASAAAVERLNQNFDATLGQLAKLKTASKRRQAARAAFDVAAAADQEAYASKRNEDFAAWAAE